MCLTFTAKLGKKKPCVKGYKIMYLNGSGHLFGEIFSCGKLRPVGKWLDENDFREYSVTSGYLTSVGGISYEIGWHIYHCKSDALRLMRRKERLFGSKFGWVIVEVQARKPVAIGVQILGGESVKVTVAKEIKITSVLNV